MRPFEFLPAFYFTRNDFRIIDVNEQFKKQYSNSFNIIARSLNEIKQPILSDNFVSSPFLAGEREFAFFQFNNTKTELVELIYDIIEFEEESVDIAFFNEIFFTPEFNKEKDSNLPTKFKFNNFAEVAFLLNDKGSIQQINQTACHKLGYSKQELTDINLSKIIYSGLESYWEIKWDLMLSNGESGGEYVLETKEGEFLFAEYRAVANIRLGLHLMLIRDIATVISNKNQTANKTKARQYN